MSEQQPGLTAVGYVADLGDGTGFTAHVEYREPGPFSFLSGPNRVDEADAVAWARRHAARVVVRIGEDFFSAGELPKSDLPQWPHQARQPTATENGDEKVPWYVEARTGWFRGDAASVARRLAEAVRADPKTAGTAHDARPRGFSVAFTIMSQSEHAAREAASRILRDAWSAAEIETSAGDYDVSSLVVRQARRWAS